MKVKMAYKCFLCETILLSENSIDVQYNDLPKMCGSVIANQNFLGNKYLYKEPLQIPHKCKDGSCGMAYFAGFYKEG